MAETIHTVEIELGMDEWVVKIHTVNAMHHLHFPTLGDAARFLALVDADGLPFRHGDL